MTKNVYSIFLRVLKHFTNFDIFLKLSSLHCNMDSGGIHGKCVVKMFKCAFL